MNDSIFLHLTKEHDKSENLVMARQAISSAEISGRLFNAQKSAAKLSLSAKNLSVIAARIGADAAGLKVLSDFYDQFAQKAIKASIEINFLANGIARNTISRWRCQMLLSKLDWVMNKNTVIDSMLQHQCQLSIKRQNLLKKESQIDCHKLARILQELLDYMKTMQVIAVNARIEACVLNSHYLQLTQLSTSIDSYSASILDDIKYCEIKIKGLIH